MGFWIIFRASPSGPSTNEADRVKLAALMEMGWRGLPGLLSIVLEADSERSRLAVDAAAGILSGPSIHRLPQLEEQLRSKFVPYRAGPSLLDELEAREPSRWALLGLMSLAPNGYLREAAIRELDRVECGSELPFLLLRANDWVHQIRSTARLAILRRIRPDYARHFVRALPMVTRLTGCRRADHADLVGRIRTFLSAQGRDAVFSGTFSSERWVRRACIELLVSADIHPYASQLEAGLDDRDPVIATNTARYVCHYASDARLSQLLTRVGSYPHARVRLALLEAADSRQLPNLCSIYNNALFDRHRSIREHARWQLQAKPGLREGSVYAEALPQAVGTRLLGALAGLGDLARSEHAEAVRPFLEKGHAPRIRCEALASYARLTKELHEVLPIALADENPRLSRLACRLMVGSRVVVPESRIAALLDAPTPGVRTRALVLLFRRGKWSGLSWALRALDLPQLSDEDRQLARQHIDRWVARFNRSFAHPRPEELREILEILPRVTALLSPSSAKFLGFVIQREKP